MSTTYRLRFAKTDRDSEWRLTAWGAALGSQPLSVFMPVLQLKTVILQAKNFLQQNLGGDFFPWVSGYLDFSRRVFWAIHDYGVAGAASGLAADVSLFISWGFNADLLSALAALQGLVL